MSKIIGITVGTTMPKSNLMQTDPTKGDYVKGKDEFLENAIPTNVSAFVNDANYATNDALATKKNRILTWGDLLEDSGIVNVSEEGA